MREIEFQVESVDLDQNYALLNAWWLSHGWQPLPKSSLPKEGLFISNKEGIPVSAGFLYLSRTDIGWVEWLVSNPEASLRERALSLPLLIQELCFLAKENGCRMVFMALKNSGLKKIVRSQGFIDGDLGIDHFVKEL